MGVEIRLPNITGKTEKEQLLQLKSYLYQLSEQLQWAFDNVNAAGGSSGNSGYVVNQTRSYSPTGTNTAPQVTFASIKSLIIKSAEIVDAYYEEINKRLEGLYVAQSDFGAFAEQTALDIEANSKGITQTYENVQIIIQNTKNEIDGDLQTIGEDLSYAQNDIITIKGNVETIDGSIATLEGDIGELDVTLQNTKTELSGNIDGAKSELSGSIDQAKGELNSSIMGAADELRGSIDNAVVNANAYADEAKKAANDYTDSTKSELDGKISDVNGRIDETKSAVGTLGDGLDAANNRIGGVETDLAGARAEINNNIQAVANSVSVVDGLLASAKSQLQGSIDDLEFMLSGLREIVVGVTAYIKSGLLYYTDAGIPVYGIEIGQQVETNGTEVFNKFARFTSEKLSFYDPNGNEVAYISDKKLFIGQAEITISLKVGGLVDLVMENGDVVTKWEGVSG